MKLLDLFESLEGYYGWINRAGKYLPGDHGTTIKQNYRDQIMRDFDVHTEEAFENIDDGECYGYGFRDGWIRVSRSQRETAFEVGRYTTPRAFKGMIRLIKEVDRQDGGMIGIQFDHHYDAFATGRQAIRWLNRMQKSIITEARGHLNFYGWIDNQGTYREGSHGYLAKNHFENLIRQREGMEYDEEGDERFEQFEPEDAVQYAYDDSWTRVYDEGMEIGFNLPDYLSGPALRKIQRIVKDAVGYRIMFEYKSSWEEFYDPKQALRWLNQTFRKVTEATNIPDTDYGYWITHHGEFLEVPYESHAAIAQRWFQKHPEEWEVPGQGRPTGYERAFQLGWIRIIERGGVGFGVRDPRICTAETLRAVLPYIRQIHPSHRLFLDLGYTAPRPTFKDENYPTKQELTKYFMHYLMGKRRPQMVAEAQIPETDYGYWITHDGQMLPVTRQAHEPVAERYLKAHPELGRPKQDAMTYVLDLGWIRIIDVWQHSVSMAMAGTPDQKEQTIGISVMDPRKVPLPALNTLLGYLRQTDAGKYYMDAFDRDIPNKRWGKNDVVNYFKQLFFQAKKQQVAESHDWSPYGYWIDAQGKALPVAHEQHERSARIHFGIPLNALGDGVGKAKESGWVRIIDNGHEFDVELNTKLATKAALKTALELLRKAETNDCYLETESNSGQVSRARLAKSLRSLLRGSITEGEIPPTRYGYWITDKGEFIPVRGQYHQMVADQYFPKGEGLNRMVRAYRAGWIRVVLEPRYLDLDIFPRAVRRLALYGALKLIKQVEQDMWPEPLKVIIDQIGVPSGRKQYENEGEANAVIRSLMKPQQMVAEGKNLIPQTDYGYWITHTGEFIKVDFQEHDYVANQYFPSGRVGAEQSGWVRVIEGYSSLEIDIPARVTKDALYRVLKLINTMQPAEIAIDVTGSNGDDRYGDFKDIGKANAFVRQFMPKGVTV